jgi:hypothetical protein
MSKSPGCKLVLYIAAAAAIGAVLSIVFVIVGIFFGLLPDILSCLFFTCPNVRNLSFSWIGILQFIVFLAAFGALIGSIVVLDTRADFGLVDRPRLRTVLGAVAGIVMVFCALGEFDEVWFLAGALAGAVLGWFGWRWVKHFLKVLSNAF